MLAAPAAEGADQVLFVCQRGNVKSVMAAAYFNELAAKRNLPLRAESRGVAPDSQAVPPSIAARLRAEGIEVSDSRALALTAEDVRAADHVVVIGAALPPAMESRRTTVEEWSDVPAAGADYAATRDSLREHVKQLLERLSRASK
jgi:protein-tyrosine-phosphatase